MQLKVLTIRITKPGFLRTSSLFQYPISFFVVEV